MSVSVVQTVVGVRKAVAEARARGLSIALVPTMGALHAGHGRLLEEARREPGFTVVSIFVNPIQFNQQADYERYPRPLKNDVDFCEARGVEVVFAPSIEEMYPGPQQTFVEVTGVSENLCGRFRPGHFRGVATVVSKLFNIVQPDRAYFGEKDAQQLAVIRRMVADLDFPIAIVEVPTVRESDGLALSSRNQHLNAEERRAATVLHDALMEVQKRIAAGEQDPVAIGREAAAIFARQPQVRVEYFEIVDPGQMQPVARVTAPVRAAGAIWVGGTRLIDNLLCTPAHR